MFLCSGNYWLKITQENKQTNTLKNSRKKLMFMTWHDMTLWHSVALMINKCQCKPGWNAGIVKSNVREVCHLVFEVKHCPNNATTGGFQSFRFCWSMSWNQIVHCSTHKIFKNSPISSVISSQCRLLVQYLVMIQKWQSQLARRKWIPVLFIFKQKSCFFRFVLFHVLAQMALFGPHWIGW